jgi:hypothetical protein
MRQIAFGVALSFSLVLFCSSVEASSYTFTEVAVPGAVRTGPNGNNNVGQIVGWYDDGGGSLTSHGFLLSQGVYTTIDYPNPGYTNTQLLGINNNGDIVGQYLTSFVPNGYGAKHSFVYSQGVFSIIPDAPGSMAGTTAASAINDSGQIVGTYVDACFCTIHAFSYVSGVFTVIDQPGYSTNAASGINGAAQIVGLSATCWGGCSPSVGFLLSAGVYTAVAPPAQPYSAAAGINDAGDIVGQYFSGGQYHAYVLSGGAFTLLDHPLSVQQTSVWGQAINSTGEVVGTYIPADGLTHGFVATLTLPIESTYYFVSQSLLLTETPPAGSVARTQDSPSVAFKNGNPWKAVGTWTGSPSLTNGMLTTLADSHVWLGLKNSDDIGTNFDVRVEVKKNGSALLLGSGEVYCVQGLTRTASQARETVIGFSTTTSTMFDGATDQVSITVLTRIGTNGAGVSCGGHTNAVGLRLYFDATADSSRFRATFQP